MRINLTELQGKFVLQHAQADCGVVCLQNIVNYYNGHQDLEGLKILSGTSVSGTTLLGLYQAAREIGLESEGCEMDLKSLYNLHLPAILHVESDRNVHHYVVFYGCFDYRGTAVYVIGDPAKGIVQYSKEELSSIWRSGACLVLTVGTRFKTIFESNKEKFRWFKGIVRPDIPILIIAAFIGIIVSGLGIVVAIFSQRLIDDILPNKQVVKLTTGIVALIVLLSLKEILFGMRQYLLLEQSRRFNIRIINFFYSRLMRLRKTFFDHKKMGEFTTRLKDVSRIEAVISYLTGNVVIDCLIVIMSAIFMATYSIIIAILSIAAIPAFYGLIKFNNRKIYLTQRNAMVTYALVDTNYISTLTAIGSIKNFGKQALFSQINSAIYEVYQQKLVAFGKLQIRISVVGGLLIVFFQTSVLFVAAHLALTGNIKAGALVAIIGMSGSLLKSAANLALTLIPLSEAKVAFERMHEFVSLDCESDDLEGPVMELESLEIKNIAFRFTGRPQLLANVSLCVAKGEIIGIAGTNGSGKTTLMELLQKNNTPEKGEIVINKKIDIKNIPLAPWRKMIAIVPQEIHILGGSILENIAFDDAVIKPGEVIEFLEQFGFGAFIKAFPQSYATMIGEDGISLSGGQKQLVGIARALYHKPGLLILDESTSFMAEEMEEFVIDLLQKVKEDAAVILITHRVRAAHDFCDRVYRLNKGKMCLEIR